MAGDNDLGSLLGGLLGDKAGGSAGGVLTSLLAAFTQGQGGSAGGNPLGGLLETLAKSGLGGQAQSWVGTGSNEQVTPDQVKEALPDATLQKVAAESGVSPDQAANDIASALPTAVDKLTPGARCLPRSTSWSRSRSSDRLGRRPQAPMYRTVRGVRLGRRAPRAGDCGAD